MDTYTFITQLSLAWAWPIATVTIAFLLRTEVGNLLQNIKQLKHKDTEINFGREVSEAKALANEEKDLRPTENDIKTYKNELATLSPRGAIIEAWLNVEEGLKDFAKRHHIEVSKKEPFSIDRLMWHNIEYRDLGSGTIEMLSKLRKIRNEAVHLKDSNISADDAKEYVALANRIIRRIEEA